MKATDFKLAKKLVKDGNLFKNTIDLKVVDILVVDIYLRGGSLVKEAIDLRRTSEIGKY